MRTNKNGKEITKNIFYILQLIMQDLWQAHLQISSATFLKEFIKLNVNPNMMMKDVKHVELEVSIVIVFLNTQFLTMIE